MTNCDIEITRSLKKNNVPDRKAQEAIWVHSIPGTKGFALELLDDFIELVQDKTNSEICCTKYTDPSYKKGGVLVKGKVTLMFTRDALSAFDEETGERFLKVEDYSAYVVKSYDDLNPTPDAVYDGCCFTSAYTESWVIPQQIVGGFIKKEAIGSELHQRLIKIFGEERVEIR